ncbi:hypothetical protein IHC87_06810 [Photobacterium damselae subsp. damselae]|uniref:hypothetical protein n=1 Tax=Photobacterium damselae TaxID=38293 RepID=UPI001F25D7D5|nr:hypothetical protein [Photobacterium damselae]UJZ95050.1 hypothetical protein IHC87_06810 [Photobacterium damselae subsp. damselae]UJZ99031.1 hypothetical protein IHC88_06800 [Photobacterium damselae subsp. damselae]
MTDAEKKNIQERFNEKFLEMSNILGGSPVALLRGSDAVQKIHQSGEVLEELFSMASAYHDDEQQDDKKEPSAPKTDSNK